MLQTKETVMSGSGMATSRGELDRIMEPDNPLHLHSAAVAAYRSGDYRAAEAYYRAAIAAAEKDGADSVNIVTIAIGLIDLYRNQGRYDEAEILCNRMLESKDLTIGASARGRIVVRLAELCRQQGRLEDAEDAYITAMAERSATYGDDHPKVAQIAMRLSEIYRDMDQPDKAARMLQQALPGVGSPKAPGAHP